MEYTSLIDIAFFALIGIVNAGTAKTLDMFMDYGHILGGIRYRIAMLHARRLGKVYVDMLEAAKGEVSFGLRLDEMDERYWIVARSSPGLVPWICLACLSFRLYVVAFASGVIFMGLDIFQAIVFFFISVASNTFTLLIMQGSRNMDININTGSDE